jgi:2-oxoglutarate ferredoxin oxidoreductase subunit delta
MVVYYIAIMQRMQLDLDIMRIVPMSETMKAKEPRGQVVINAELCKGCGFCIEFCPAGVLAFSDEFNSKGYHPPCAVKAEACTGCDLCGIYCPDFAIFGLVLKSVA